MAKFRLSWNFLRFETNRTNPSWQVGRAVLSDGAYSILMASPDCLKILEQGVPAWNRWRQEHPDIRPDLSGVDLSSRDLRQADLRDVKLCEANLIRADLRGAFLSRADLSGVDLRGASGLTLDQIQEALVRDSTKLPQGLAASRTGELSNFNPRRDLFSGVTLLLISTLVFYIQATPQLPEIAVDETSDSPVALPIQSTGKRLPRKPAVTAGNVESARDLQPKQRQREGQPTRLTDLTVSRESDAVRIHALLGDKVQFETFRVESPNRVVIDIPDVILAIPPEKKNQELSHLLVTQLRIEQHTFVPPLVRLVLEVPAFPEVQVMSEATGLAVRISQRRR